MNRGDNEWNDPEGVWDEDDRSTSGQRPPSGQHTPQYSWLNPPGPFRSVRRLLWWLFFLGFVAAAIVGALGGTQGGLVSRIIQLMLGMP